MAERAVTVSFTEDGLAILRMNRGENRINMEFLDAYNSCLDEVERNPDCRGLVSTGQGKYYSNGLDLQDVSGDVLRQQADGLINLATRILVFPLPTLAAINGHAFAGGAVLAMAHDLRVMNSQRGWICMNEVLINLRLPIFFAKLMINKVNPSAINKLLVLAHRFTAQEAESEGMVDKIAMPALLLSDSQRLLRTKLGKAGYQRDSLSDMKKDVYSEVLKVVSPAKM